MQNSGPSIQVLPYTPAQVRPLRQSKLGIASIAVACVSVTCTAGAQFREGLTQTEAARQLFVGAVISSIVGALAIVLALVSYRHGHRGHPLSHVGITLSACALLYALMQFV